MENFQQTLKTAGLILLYIFFSTKGIAQEKLTLTAEEFMQPYKIETAQSRSNETKEFYTKIDQTQIQSIIKVRPPLLDLELYDEEGNLINLELEINNFFTEDFQEGAKQLNSGSASLYDPFIHGIHYIGKIKNEKESFAAISLYGTSLQGSIDLFGKTININPLNKEKQLYRTFQKELSTDINCSIKTENNQVQQPDRNAPIASSRSSNTCVKATLFTTNGVSTDVALNIFNASVALYASIGVQLELLSVSHHGPSADKFVLLDQVRNPSGSDISIVVVPEIVGGVAITVGSMGHSNSVCVGQTDRTVIAHEIGHLLGAAHTHDCAWNGNNTPIDGCGFAIEQGACHDAPIPSCGTIMSYCHVGGPICVSFQFHPQVQARIASYVQSNSPCGSGGGTGGGGTGGGGGGGGSGCSLNGGDHDGDGVCDDIDNCVFVFNPGQDDFDNDGRGDVCDNCPSIFNPSQSDSNGNGIGDVCDINTDPCYAYGGDSDGDGICNNQDNCAFVFNPGQDDFDNDGIGDVCDTYIDPCYANGGDSDGDGICNYQDCSPYDANFPKPVGTSCNDGNTNTVNDVIQNNGCTCAGTFDPCAAKGGDSDGDGVCKNDDCAPFDANFPKPVGTSCNDNNANTVNDVIQSDGCTCAGTFDPCAAKGGDSDGDGVCNDDDCAPFDKDFPLPVGTSCNDNNANTLNDVIQSDGCTCAGTFDPCAAKGGDSDGDGVCDEEDCAPFDKDFPLPVGTSCNDGNTNTINDVIQSDGCTCRGEEVTPSSIGDLVFNDLDQDGIQDANESGVSGVTVQLKNCNNTVLTTTTTDGNGQYNFGNLDQGCYRIGIVLPNGFSVSPQNVGNDANDSDISPTSLMTGNINLNQGQDDLTNDAGIIRQPEPKASIGNQVWNDINKDGFKNANEPGLNGVAIKLLATNGNVLATTTTSNEGNYSFDDLTSDTYQIMFETPTGFNPSPQTGSDDNDIDNNSDNNPNDGNRTVLVFLSPGESNSTIDAGFFVGTVCDNLTFGGKIGFGNTCAGSTELCGASETSPQVTNCDLPTGGAGTIEYIWLKNEISCDSPTGTIAQMIANQSAYNWSIIPNANSPSFNPGTLTTSTCFLRFARRADCTVYLGASNIVRVEVHPNCGGNGGGTTTETCGSGTSITYGNGAITMEGGSFYQIFDTDWNQLYNCGWECGNSKTVDGLAQGGYRIIIKNSNHEVICEKVITLSANTGGGDPDNDGDGIIASQDCNDNDVNLTIVGAICNDGNATTENDVVQSDCSCAGTPIDTGGGNTGSTTTASCHGGTSITYGNGTITMQGGSFYQILDAGWDEIYNCGWQCGDSKTVNDLAVGEYRIYIKNSNYEVICEKVITLSANTDGGGNTEGGDPDNDGDGVVVSQDCNDNDANLTTVGATCNDGNANTENDVVQENCICVGTPIDTGGGNTGGGAGNDITCDDIVINYGGGTIAIEGVVGQEYFFKINDLHDGWAQVGGCGWNCGHQLEVTGLANSKYLITIFNSDWSKHCDIEITMDDSHFAGDAGSRNAPQLSFAAYRVNREVALQWLTNSGFKVTNFEVERSLDGEHFSSIAQFVNKEWSDELEYHQTMDAQPTTGTNYYRVKEIYLDGSFAYTDVQKVGFAIDLNGIAVFPNPVQNELFVSLKPYVGQQGVLTLTNQFGQKVRAIELGTIKEDLIQMNTEQLVNGLYYLNVQIDKHKSFTKKVMVKHLY